MRKNKHFRQAFRFFSCLETKIKIIKKGLPILRRESMFVSFDTNISSIVKKIKESK